MISLTQWEPNRRIAVISDTYKTVFIHNPKCAGTSIKVALHDFWPDWEYGDWHYTLKQLSTMTDIRDYYKFAVVRNPYDRFVSSFIYNLEKVSDPLDYHWLAYPLSYKVLSSYVIRENSGQDTEPLSGSDLIKSFRAFVQSEDFVHVHDRGWPIHMRPQSYFFKESDMDTVCYFEDLLGPSCKLSKVEEDTGLRLKVPYTNMSAHPDYQEFYDVKTMDIVKLAFYKDFIEFGYDPHQLGGTR
jgi:hypothetical protein